MIVKANKVGFFGGRLVRVGEVFDIELEQLGKWMTPQEPVKKARKKRSPKIVPIDSLLDGSNSEEGA